MTKIKSEIAPKGMEFKPTEFMLCNKMSEMTMDEMVNNKSTFTFNFPKSFLKRNANAPIKPS